MATVHSTVFFYVTDKGRATAETLARSYPDAKVRRLSRAAVKACWQKGARLVFVMAAGIVVRMIAPLVGDKRTDPAVVLLDEWGAHVISLLSGHLGGANALAGEIARLSGGTAVITTASDAGGLPAIDLWAEGQGLAIEDWKRLPKVGARLLREKSLRLFSDVPVEAPPAFVPAEGPSSADIVVTNRKGAAAGPGDGPLLLRPKNLLLGIGCNSGTQAGEIEQAVRKGLDDHDLSFLSVRAVATIDAKGAEPGLRAFAEGHGLALVTFSAGELNRVAGVTPSDAAMKATGAQAVAEPAALLAAVRGRLIVRKQKAGNVTLAVAEESTGSSREEGKGRPEKGAIYIVGTGPGDVDHLTGRALAAIRASDAVVGYGPYLDLLAGLIAGKEVVATGMSREIDRCMKAIALSDEGKTVSVVSGGDPGIYAMAGLVLDLLRKAGGPDAGRAVEVIPGISALGACAARLGAPLMHDFASISLSDRLTPWGTIEERLDAAARADFVIVLYNPRSHGRGGHLEKARRIILRHRDPSTPVGVVRAAMRADERVIVTDLAHLPVDEIDMRTTVIVGNSKTTVWERFMITPRGYERKEGWEGK